MQALIPEAIGELKNELTCRQIKLPRKSIHAASVLTGPPGPRGVLDGDLLTRFLHFSLVHQRELAKAIGSRDDRILDDLLELSIGLEYF
jgi:hypothetical protein